jgi:hypothetical protein
LQEACPFLPHDLSVKVPMLEIFYFAHLCPTSLFWPRQIILGILDFLQNALTPSSRAETTEQEAALQRGSDFCILSFLSGNIFSLFSVQYLCSVRGQQRYKPRRQGPHRPKQRGFDTGRVQSCVLRLPKY